jgi:LmbE family N-acetylglucosaminyl deacetylase
MRQKDIVARCRRDLLRSIAAVFGKPLAAHARPLIIAPHPDDEVFGCGGFLGKLVDSGVQAHVLFLTGGGGSHRACCMVGEEIVTVQRRLLAADAASVLGIPDNHLQFLGEVDGQLPRKGPGRFPLLSQKIADCIRAIQPKSVFCPHPFEGWADHMAAEELTRAALGTLPEAVRPRLFHYCVWFWYSMPLKQAIRIDWRQARLLDISAQLPLKRQAIRTYLQALAPCGYPWVGNLPAEFLRAFEWDKELFFEADAG